MPITFLTNEDYANLEEIHGNLEDLQTTDKSSLVAAINEAANDIVERSDLASDVQTSLNKADTALQSFTETDPTVPAWAKASSKPSYTASEVGADASGTATTVVSTHNTATDAHNDMRLLIDGLTTRLNTLADSDDTTLDQMSEIVAYIKSNKSLIDSITTSKVNISDIIDNLTTNVSNKPLSAAQGVALKALIDAIIIPTKVSELTNDSGYITSFTETDPTVPAWAKASTKPSYTASEVGAAAEDHKHMYDEGITTAGDGATYTATVDGITALTAGQSFIMTPHVVSTTTAPKLNLNGLGAKLIRRRISNSTATTVAGSEAGWLAANKPVRVTYDGTYWIVDITRPNATDIYGTIPITSGGTGATTAADALANLGAASASDLATLRTEFDTLAASAVSVLSGTESAMTSSVGSDGDIYLVTE